MDKEDNDIMLIVLLVIARYINDAISERGIVIDIISVALHLPKREIQQRLQTITHMLPFLLNCLSYLICYRTY